MGFTTFVLRCFNIEHTKQRSPIIKTMNKNFLYMPLLMALVVNTFAQSNSATSTRPNSFIVQSGQAGSTIDVSLIQVTDLNSGNVVYSNSFNSLGDATRGLIGYYWPQGGSGNTNYQINGSMTSIQNGKLRIQTTGFNQNGAGGYNSHSEVIYTNTLPQNFFVQVTGQRVQWAGASVLNLFRNESSDALYGFVPGGALSSNRNLGLQQDVVEFMGQGNWFNPPRILTNYIAVGNSLPWKSLVAPSGSWTDLHTLGIALSNNIITAFLDGRNLGSLTNAAWTNSMQTIVFDYGYKSLSDTNATNYIVSTQNMRRYSEWQSPPTTYWGPATNNIPAYLTMAFPIPSNASQVALTANLASFNFNLGGGLGVGSNSLWASKDNTNWTLLLNNPTPSSTDSYKTFTNNLPANVLGSGTIYLQIRSLVAGAPNSSYTDAQFSRSDTKSTNNVFRITAYIPNQVSQQIMIPPLSSVTYSFNAAPISLNGTTSSGLPLSYNVISGPASITGTNLYVQGAGTILIQASQAGNGFYAPAQTVFSILVNKSSQSISIPSISFNGTSSSGLGINYQVTSGNASIAGNTLSVFGSGTIVVVASQSGNVNYNQATNVTNILIVPTR
jgi:hypothetical protein